MIRVFRHFLPGASLFLVLMDILALATVCYLVVMTAGMSMLPSPPWLSAQVSLLISALAILGMGALGLYSPLVLLNYRITFVRTFLAFVLVAPVIFVAAAVCHKLFGFPQGITAVSYAEMTLVGLIAILATRTTFWVISTFDMFKRQILVIGAGDTAARIARLADSHAIHPFKIKAFVKMAHEPVCVPCISLDLGQSQNPDSLVNYAREQGVREIVIATSERRGLPVHPLLRCKLAGIRTTDFLSFWERECGRVNIDVLQPSWLVFSDGFRVGRLVSLSKRLFDIAVSVFLLIFTAPILLASAIAIKLDSPGPVFYRQVRVGLHGHPFTILKFRSMAVKAEQEGSPQWACLNDDRVTRVGSVIRKIRIDELPQLLNVLWGAMSFVGPRPERPHFVEQLAAQIPFYRERHSVKPGITGWAQISYRYGASLEDAREKLSYDLYYVKNRGLFLDFVILMETVRVVLWADGGR